MMCKKILLIGTLVMALTLQNTAVSFAEGTTLQDTKSSDTQAASTDGLQFEQLSPEELKQLAEALKKEAEALKKAQAQLEMDREQFLKEQNQLKIDQELLKKNQEQLKKAQDQLKADRDKLQLQEKRKQLAAELTSSTYIKYLKQLGYYKNTSKDEALNKRNALLLFQSDHNMSLTGVWDNATEDMLINRLTSKSMSYADKVTGAPTTGKWIVVNKTKRLLTLYEDARVIKKYPVAVGNPHTLTKSGKFYINSKIVDPDWGGGGFAKPVKGGTPENPLGSRWMGINRTDGSYGIHGTNSFYSIGKFISHGCIRMQNYCVEELFPLVPMKAPVWVGTQEELKKWGITQEAFTANY